MYLCIRHGFQPLVAPNSCRRMSVGTREWKSIVHVTRKLIWRRTGEGLKPTYHGRRRSRSSGGLAHHRRRGSWLPVGGAVGPDNGVAQGRDVGGCPHGREHGRMLKVRVWVRRSPWPLSSTPARLRAEGKRTSAVAGPVAIQPTRQRIIGPIEFPTSQRTIPHLRARLLRSKLYKKTC